MMILNLLKMMADLSFYYTFASVIAIYLNKESGDFIFIRMFLLCLCFGISADMWKHKTQKIFQLAMILPAILSFLVLKSECIDFIVFVPAVVYVLYLIWAEKYGLSRYRQMELFSVFIKVFLVFIIVLFIIGGIHTVYPVSLWMAVIMLVSSVTLMRILRLEPGLYMEKNYQLRNLFSVAGVVFAAGLFSTKAVRKSVFFIMSFAYERILAPILMAISMVIGFIMMGFWQVIRWILIKLGMNESVFVEVLGNMGSDEKINRIQANGQIGKEWFVQLLAAVGIIAVVIAAFLFFRWISRTTQEKPQNTGLEEMRIDHHFDNNKLTLITPGSAVDRVRKQYRNFLKLSIKKGISLHPSNTSLDIEKRTAPIFKNQNLIKELRLIYIDARYNNKADRKAVNRAKKIYNLIKKEKV